MFFIVAICITLYFAIFDTWDEVIKVGPTLIALGISFIFILVIARISNKLSKKQLIILSCINLAIFIALQLFFGYFFAINPSWDISAVFNGASDLALNKAEFLPNYFKVFYPNNIFITVLWSLFYKFCFIIGINFLNASIVLNMLVVLTSVILTYIIILKIFDLKIATIASYLFILITPFYTYTSIFYTDTLTMIFLPLVILLILRYKDTNNILYLLFAGFVMAFGVGIKSNIVIGFIAIIIYLIFSLDKFKDIIKMILIMCVAFTLTTAGIAKVNQKYIDVPLKSAGLPYTHWIMMGLANSGGYGSEDVQASKKAGPNKEDIKKFNVQMIQKRLSDYGFNGYMKFLYKKLRYTWGDGTYFASVLLKREPVRQSELHEYVSLDKRTPFVTFAEGTHSLLLILILIGAISLFKIRKNNRLGYLFNISIFGTFLFLILWETKSRYIICMLPLFICSASYGLNLLSSKNEK